MKTIRKTKLLLIIIPIVAALVALALFSSIEKNEKSTNETLQPQNNLKIDVYAQQIISVCEKDVQCAVNLLQELANEKESDVILTTFKNLISQYEREHACHRFGHHLGMWLYTYMDDVDQALAQVEMVCGGAIFHGVVQNYLITEHLANTDPSEIVFDKICPKNENHPYAIERWQCLHGLGHGLSSFYDHDVFEAVKICEQFDPGWEQISCSKGVFMQNVVYNLDTGGGTFDKDDRFYPCNKVDSKWAPQCYHYHTTYFIFQNKFSVTKSFNDCDKITPEEFVKYCYHGMGRQLEQNIRGQIDKAIEFCIEGKQSIYHADCFRGMVMTIVNGNTDPKIGFQYCSLIPEEFKVDCYDALGRWVHMLQSTDEGRSTECIIAENSDYFDICMNASLESLKLL